MPFLEFYKKLKFFRKKEKDTGQKFISLQRKNIREGINKGKDK